MDFDVVLQPDPSGGYAVTVPALPGCFSQGRTREEALEHVQEAIAGFLATFGMPDPPVLVERVSVPA